MPQSPPNEPRVAAIARARGMRVELGPDVDVGGVRVPSCTILCRDNEAALELLNDLAEDDATFGDKVRRLADRLALWVKRNANGSPAVYARKAHGLVASSIVYLEDPEQVFRSSDTTLALGAGNCVNSARLLVALCKAVGVRAECAPVRPRGGEITHTAPRIGHDGAWHWAETTLHGEAASRGLAPPAYGEAPLDAARRLGVLRQDLAASRDPSGHAELARRGFPLFG